MGHFYNEFDPAAAEWLRELMKAGLIPEGEVDERSITEVRADDLRGFHAVHLFAGIGGWPYALRLAGWPDERPVWTGSCPCQSFSAAGKQLGYEDPRDLWPHMFRLVRECSPHVVFGEQVEGAVKHGWLDRVSADLEAEGYAVGSVVLGAHSVGSPHIRQRLYWVADAESGQQSGATKRRQRSRKVSDSRQNQAASSGRSRSTRGLAHTDGRESGDGRVQRGGQHGQQSEDGGSGVAQGDTSGKGRQERTGNGRVQSGTRQPGTGQAIELSGDLGFWSAFDLIPCRDGKARRVEPGSFPLVDGLPGRVGLLRGYGNAICPQTAAEFVRAWIEVKEAA